MTKYVCDFCGAEIGPSMRDDVAVRIELVGAKSMKLSMDLCEGCWPRFWIMLSDKDRLRFALETIAAEEIK